jgi:hypothetical protein
MARWVVRLVVAATLVAPLAIVVASPAHAGLEPPGSCTYQAGAADATLTPLANDMNLVQLSASIGPPLFGAATNCVTTLTGTFTIDATAPFPVQNNDPLSGTVTPCAPDPAGTGLGAATCLSFGELSVAPIETAYMTFTGTITALNDGVSQTVTCQAEFDPTAFCWFGNNPAQVLTL